MGKPIDEYPLRVLYRVDCLLPGEGEERWVALLSQSINRPAPERVRRTLDQANGLRTKGSPKIERLRLVEITERVVNEGSTYHG